MSSVPPVAAAATLALSPETAARVDAWVLRPLDHIQDLLDQQDPATLVPTADWGVPAAVAAAFHLPPPSSAPSSSAPSSSPSSVDTLSLLEQVPLLNHGADLVGHLQLTRFRCMVQDVCDPEFFPPTFVQRDLRSGATRLRSGKYQEDPVGPDGAVVEQPAGGDALAERGVLRCVAIPGETPWVRASLQRAEGEARQAALFAASFASSSASASASAPLGLSSPGSERKRGRAAADAMSDAAAGLGDSFATLTPSSPVPSPHSSFGSPASTSTSSLGASTSLASPAPHAVALPSAAGSLVCIVKVYDEDMARFKVGDAVEFTGVLSIVHEAPLSAFASSASASASSSSPSSPSPTDPFAAARQSHRAAAVAAALGSSQDSSCCPSPSPSSYAPAAHADADSSSALPMHLPDGCYVHMDDVDFPAPAADVPLRLHALLARPISSSSSLPSSALSPYSSLSAPADPATRARILGALASDPALAAETAGLSADVPLLLLLRTVLLGALRRLCLDDVLTAEALLFWMLSRVHSRATGRPIGQLALALTHLARVAGQHPPTSSPSTLTGSSPEAAAHAHAHSHTDSADPARAFVAALHALLAQVLPRLVTLDAASTALCAARWGPVKDHERGVLVQAPLQVTAETHAVVDATRLPAGTHEGTAAQNLHLLARLAQDAVLLYDYPYCPPLELPVDIPLLVLSAEEAELPHSLSVPLVPRRAAHATAHAGADVSDAGATEQTHAGTLLAPWLQTPETAEQAWLLGLLRQYVETARHVPFDISERAAEWMMAEFVQLRRDRPRLSEAQMHLRATLARLAAISRGQTDLDEEAWAAVTRFADEAESRGGGVDQQAA